MKLMFNVFVERELEAQPPTAIILQVAEDVLLLKFSGANYRYKKHIEGKEVIE